MLDVIVTCKSLDEGFDYPIDAALILSASTTNRQRIQKNWKSLRKSTNKKCSHNFFVFIRFEYRDLKMNP